MKKVLSVLLAALMILSVFSMIAFAGQNTDIDFISINNVVAPVAGKSPSYTCTNIGTNYHFCDEYESEYVKNCMEWFDMTANKSLKPTDTFVAGHQYSVTFYLIADDNYIFPEVIMDVYVNGVDSQGAFIDTSAIGHSFRYQVIRVFPVLDEAIESIAVTGVTAPAKGAKPAYKATVASTAPYTITSAYDMSTIKNGVSWYDKTGKKTMAATDTFEVGHIYTVTVILRAKEYYAFPRIFLGDATVNGKDAEKGPKDQETLADYVQDYMVIYTFPEIVDDTTPINFPDVSSNAWFYNAVQYCAQKDFITGYKNGKFGPADPLQRQDFVVIIARIAQADTAFYTYCKLKDVDMKAYYGPAVAWAEDNDIVHGYVNGKFGVGDKITREQVVTILYRFLGSPAAGSGNIMNGFPDRTKVSEFADEAMIWAVNNGIISGKNGKLAPQDNASRAEIATIIMQMDKKGMF